MTPLRRALTRAFLVHLAVVWTAVTRATYALAWPSALRRAPIARAHRFDATWRRGLVLALTGGMLGVPVLALGAAPAGATTPSCTTSSTPLGTATGWTEFIQGSGSRTSESEGSIAWGGDLNAGGTNMTVGTRLNPGASVPTLVVGGAHGTFNLQQGSAYVNPQTGVNFNGGGTYLASNPINFTSAFSDLQARSTTWAGATANGAAALGVVGGQNMLVLTGTASTLNVFSVTPAQLTSGQGIAYDVPAGSTVLVNVSGTSVTLQGQMYIKDSGSFTQVNDTVMANWPNIIWNFNAATSITMNVGSAWGGTIVAPNATLTINSVGHTIGQIVTKSFTSGYETHQRLVTSSACLPTSGPAASPAISLTKTASAINDVDSNGPDAGDTITYSFVVQNTGNVTLSSVAVNDPLFGGTSPNVTCPSTSLAAGASMTCTSKTYTLTQANVDAGKVDNTATATGTYSGTTVTSSSSVTKTITRSPAILLTKSASAINDVDGNGTDAGDTITYSFSVQNTGNVTLGSIALSDPMFGGAISCPSSSLAPGATMACTSKTYTITASDMDNGTVVNTATVSGTGGGTTVSDTDTVTKVVDARPAIQVVKSASAINDVDGNGTDAGDTITYGFVVTNTGNVTLSGIAVNDPLFGGTSPNVTCPSTSLGAGASMTCTSKTYTLTQADIDAGSRVNTVTATGTKGGTTVSDTDTVTKSTAGTPAIKLTKTASAIADNDGNGTDAGDTITYSFSVKNTGTVSLSGIALSDPMFGGAITCPSTSLAVGATMSCTSKTHTLTQAEVDNGTLTNTATVSGSYNGTSVTDSASVTKDVNGTNALYLAKTASAINDVDGNGPDAGDTITYAFVITNTGTTTLTSVGLSDPMFGGAISCPSTTLAPGASMTCSSKTKTLTQADVNAGSVANTATATGTHNGTTVSDTDSTSTPVAPWKVCVGDYVWVDANRNGVQDSGESGLSGVKLTLTGPGGGSVTDVYGNAVGAATTNGAGAYHFCDLPVLPAGQSYTVHVDNTQPALSGYQPTVTGAGTAATDSSNGTASSGDLTSNGATDDTLDFGFKVPNAPVIRLDKTASAISDVDGNGPDAGDTITYSFVVSNPGEVALSGVALTDPMFGGAISCPSTSLAAGASMTCSSKTYTLTQADVNAGSVANTASVSGTYGGTTVTDTDSTSTPVAPWKVCVGDYVWVDANRNGVQDSGESGLSGVKLTLTGPGGGSVTDVYGNAVGVATTNGAGAYHFCDLPVLPAGQSYTVHVDNTQPALSGYQPTVTGAGTAATDSSNGTASSGDLTSNGATDNTLDFGFQVPAAPAIRLDKTASAITDVDGNGADAGDTITYAFVVTNTGNVALTGIAVNDPLFGGTSPNITCPSTSLAAGASMTCTSRTYTLTQADVDGGSRSNTATATGAYGATTVSDTDSVTKPVAGTPAIRLDKTASAIDDVDGNGPDAGDQVTYAFVVYNTGTVTLGSVALTDPMFGGAISCPSTSLAAGASMTCASKTYTLTQADVNAGSVANTASVSGTYGGTTVSDTDSTSTPVAPWKVCVGDYVWVDANRNGVQDSGESGLSGVKLTLTGPGGGSVTDVYGNAVGVATTNGAGAYHFCDLPVLPAGQSYTVHVDNTQPALAGYQPTVTGAGTAATDSSNGTASSGDLTVNGARDDSLDFGFVVDAPAITLDKSAGGVTDVDGNGADAGDTITYAFVVTNTGNVALTSVALTDPMFGGAITCPSTSLAVGASMTCTSQTYTLTQADVDRGSVSNTATVSGDGAGTPVSDDDTVTLTVPAPSSIRLDKTASAVDDNDGNGDDEGDTITYAFLVTNTGNTTLTNLVISDPMVGTVTCPSGPLAPGASVSCSQATYTITTNDLRNGGVTNSAQVTGTTPGGGSVNSYDQVSTPLHPAAADLVVTKDVDNTHPRVGDVVTYTITVTNTGDARATDVVITDALPGGVTFVSASSPCTVFGQTVSCSVGTIPVGGSATVTIQAQVNALPPASADEQHLLDVQKTEAQIDLEPGQTRTVAVTCQSGYVVADGSGRVDAVDQGTGTLASVKVIESRATTLDTWQVTMVNDATGRAQAKVFALCIKQQTNEVQGHTHDIVVSSPTTQTVPLGAGTTTVTLTCGSGQTPIQPGYLLDGKAAVVTSYPSGANAWTWEVTRSSGDTATAGSFSLRCMDTALALADGHSHNLQFKLVQQTVTVPAGQTAEVTLDCGVDYKGIVAGYRVDSGLVMLGNDPRPIIRVFKLYNPTSGPLTADLSLLCMNLRTQGGDSSGRVVNTASATTSAVETNTGNNSDTATFIVDTYVGASLPASVVAASPAKATTTVSCSGTDTSCAGSASLLAAKTQRLGGVLVKKGTVLAKGRYDVASGDAEKLKLEPTRTGRQVLGSRKLTTATMKIGGLTQKVHLQH